MTVDPGREHLPAKPPPLSSSADPDLGVDRDHGPIYRAIYHIEARIDALEETVDEHRTASNADRRAMHGQLERHVAVLRIVQTRLNLIVVLMISLALFALAGPKGLIEIGNTIAGRANGIGAEAVATLAGVAIPLLYPLGRRLFLSVRPETPQQREVEYGHQDH